MLGMQFSPSSLSRETADEPLDESDILSINPKIKHLGVVLLVECKALHLRALDNQSWTTSLSLLRQAVDISKRVSPESFSFLAYQGKIIITRLVFKLLTVPSKHQMYRLLSI
jgi:hypothetical protein